MKPSTLLRLAFLVSAGACGKQAEPEPRAAVPAAYDTGARRLPTDRLDPVALRVSLTTGDYDAIERVYAAYQDSIRLSPRYERHLSDFAVAFWVADAGIGAGLDRWVTARAASPAARVARAGHHMKLGWRARGGAWAAETADSSFRAMRSEFVRAAEDVKVALERDSRSLLGYQLLIDMASSQGDTAAARGFLRKSIEILPGTELNRSAFMAALYPRWGGSYDAMRSFAAECDSAVASNPRLGAMRGLIEYDQARELVDDKKLDSAWALLERAVATGDLRAVRQLRGDVAEMQGHYLRAVQEYDRALALSPNNADLLHSRSYAALEVVKQSLSPRFEPLLWQAVRDGERAAALEPWDKDRREWGETMRQTEAELRSRSGTP